MGGAPAPKWYVTHSQIKLKPQATAAEDGLVESCSQLAARFQAAIRAGEAAGALANMWQSLAVERNSTKANKGDALFSDAGCVSGGSIEGAKGFAQAPRWGAGPAAQPLRRAPVWWRAGRGTPRP